MNRLNFKFISFLTLCRLKFLLYSPILYTIGAYIVKIEKNAAEYSINLYLLGIVFVWNTHIMTHLFNEYYDLPSDRLNTTCSPWTGGSRILVKGIFNPVFALRCGYFSMILSIILSLFMPTVISSIICFFIIFFGYAYSSPPFKLESNGLGEFTVTMTLNILVPLLGYFMQLPTYEYSDLLFVLIPLAIIEFIRMMVMNIPDMEADAKARKSTLVTKIGLKKTSVFFIIGVIICYSFNIYLYFSNIHPIIISALLLTAPIGIWLSYRIEKGITNSYFLYTLPYWASTYNGMAASVVLISFIMVEEQKVVFELWPVMLYFNSFLLQKK